MQGGATWMSNGYGTANVGAYAGFDIAHDYASGVVSYVSTSNPSDLNHYASVGPGGALRNYPCAFYAFTWNPSVGLRLYTYRFYNGVNTNALAGVGTVAGGTFTPTNTLRIGGNGVGGPNAPMLWFGSLVWNYALTPASLGEAALQAYAYMGTV
jgi:hypothetical protein